MAARQRPEHTMSYDVEVFSTEKPNTPASEVDRFWQIAVDDPLNVEPEDISGIRSRPQPTASSPDSAPSY